MSDKRQLVQQEIGKEAIKREFKKSLETTMIGALASAEKYFGDLWGHNSENPTSRQKAMKQLFEDFRSEVLDKGNLQVRQIPTLLENFEVTKKRYVYNIPIQFKKDRNNEERD